MQHPHSRHASLIQDYSRHVESSHARLKESTTIES